MLSRALGILACVVLSGCAASAAPPTATVAPAHSPRTSGGHPAPHGGVVLVYSGDKLHLHVEVVVSHSGEVRLYPSDEDMLAIPAKDASATVRCRPLALHGAETAVEAAAQGDGSLAAACPSLDVETTLVGLDLKMRGISMVRVVPVPRGGTADIQDEAWTLQPDRRATVAPGEFYELNLVFTSAADLDADFTASAPLEWNVHSHPDGGLTIHQQGNDARARVHFRAETPGVYSLMWKNATSAPVELALKIAPARDVKELREIRRR